VSADKTLLNSALASALGWVDLGSEHYEAAILTLCLKVEKLKAGYPVPGGNSLHRVLDSDDPKDFLHAYIDCLRANVKRGDWEQAQIDVEALVKRIAQVSKVESLKKEVAK
jgi:hypothetical protein